MLTIKNNTIDYKNIFENDYDIMDIATGLSNECRFNGHVPKFYSVAEHSVHLSKIIFMMTKCPKEAFHALLHDASEAYLKDIPFMLKEFLPDYMRIEKEFQKAIGFAFNIPEERTSLIKDYDHMLGWFEFEEMKSGLGKYIDPIIIRNVKINNWTPEQAYIEFLKQFYELQLKIIQSKEIQ